MSDQKTKDEMETQFKKYMEEYDDRKVASKTKSEKVEDTNVAKSAESNPSSENKADDKTENTTEEGQ